ncbi:ComEA family DNA-binding protein [Methylobacterium nodulans]|uniref:Helix-hairpin-helix motif protein n=1 Tax=Methylobacterium nodulans (strain LMG 21967 / CNCM I-2342 / ORS 2060) TaxID=460265 RepID=B8ISV0_METNO|nr:helix-hairpin-helix domain-containing protein [Methylobacterium nodulans]ACL60749.1 helix-hairpin-helix motif protein [Methylobacterium nodulans ORS 2060]
MTQTRPFFRLGRALAVAALLGAAAPALAQAPAPAPATKPAPTSPAPATKPAPAPAAAPSTAPAAKPALIDLNSATKEELDALPGIGAARAEAIIKGRPYRGKDELVSKKIIPSNVYEGIKDRIVARQKT